MFLCKDLQTDTAALRLHIVWGVLLGLSSAYHPLALPFFGVIESLTANMPSQLTFC